MAGFGDVTNPTVYIGASYHTSQVRKEGLPPALRLVTSVLKGKDALNFFHDSSWRDEERGQALLPHL
jgi:hypothetical protein